MSKSFTAAPKPKLPTDEQIAAFERGGVGHDTRSSNVVSHKTGNVGFPIPTDEGSHIPTDEGFHKTGNVKTNKGLKAGSHKGENVGSRKPTNVNSPKNAKAPGQEPTKRLSLDLPTSLHRRFKTACSATDTKMVREVMDFIEGQTVALEKRAGIKR